MKLSDYFTSKADGSGSVTKTFVTLAHVLLFLTVIFVTILKRDFHFEMWSLYLGATIFHATYDKTMAVVSEYKNKFGPEPPPYRTDPQG